MQTEHTMIWRTANIFCSFRSHPRACVCVLCALQMNAQPFYLKSSTEPTEPYCSLCRSFCVFVICFVYGFTHCRERVQKPFPFRIPNRSLSDVGEREGGKAGDACCFTI